MGALDRLRSGPEGRQGCARREAPAAGSSLQPDCDLERQGRTRGYSYQRDCKVSLIIRSATRDGTLVTIEVTTRRCERDTLNNKLSDQDARLPTQGKQIGMPSLSEALRNEASDAVVLALLAAHPEGAKEKDENGNLPLHFAVAYEASEAVVQALLAAHPEGAKEKNTYGSLPLHRAVEEQASDAVVLALLAAHPEGAKEKSDQTSSLPLHAAVAVEASDAVVLALLEVYPLASLRKDGSGRLPLDIALESGAARELLAALAQAQMKMLAVLADPAQHVDLPVGAPPKR
eukprot:scaffold47726_cov53-Phaeocystis_antarctica.AAC.4